MAVTNGENGMYVSRSLLTRKIEWLVDISCNVTILLADVFNSLAVQERQRFKQTQQELNQADGTPLEVLGKAEMTFRIVQQKCHCRVIVANCLMDGLLGMNFLQGYGACLNIKKGTVKLGGQNVPTYQKDQDLCCRVTAAGMVTVKTGHYMNVDTKYKNPDWIADWLVGIGEDCVLCQGTHAATLQLLSIVKNCTINSC